LQGPIRPRLAKAGERITLLDEKTVELRPDTLIITDDSGPIGIAGIMGGLSTAVSGSTTDVFFEGAFWPPTFMAGRARAYGMHTDASLRFERGVDPEGQGRAVERATELLIDIAGGKAGPLVVESSTEHLPAREPISLRRERLARLLGLAIADSEIEQILRGLELETTATADGWKVTPPSHRFDIEIEADLIEEVARIHGYDSIPETTAFAAEPLEAVTESRIEFERVAATLVARDYQEVVTYSFVDAAANKAFSGLDSELILSNPISSEMSVMRASLWPGLVAAAAANFARQQDRVRLFEASKTFHGTLEETRETMRVGALISGSVAPEQWGREARNADFFDIKSDVEALLLLAASHDEISFAAVSHPALQDGQAAEIRRGDSVIGILGKLHPSIAKRYNLKRPAYAFELDAELTFASGVPSAALVSRFPAIRRDIAVVVDNAVTADELIAAIRESAAELIQNVKIFDIYTGPGIEAGRKSVAIGLILQATSRTLTDDDADAAMAAAISKLKKKYAAELRD
jgi:phenylalanyl-tRNA synthetase beta chain